MSHHFKYDTECGKRLLIEIELDAINEEEADVTKIQIWDSEQNSELTLEQLNKTDQQRITQRADEIASNRAYELWMDKLIDLAERRHDFYEDR